MEENIFLGLFSALLKVSVARQRELPGKKKPCRFRVGNVNKGLFVRLIGLDTVPRQKYGGGVLKCFAGSEPNVS